MTQFSRINFETHTLWSPRYFRVEERMVEERIKKFLSRSIKGDSKLWALKTIVNMIDLTSLEGKDGPQKIIQLCHKAVNPFPTMEVPSCAAVCVYPNFVSLAKKQLQSSSVKVASVVSGFPAGQVPLSIKLEDVKLAVGEGADEIDMVISRGKFLAGEYTYVQDEISAIKEAAGKNVRLKVILETGELGSLENVKKASILAILSGADFIKTSTGKIQPSATLPVTYVMLNAIKDSFDSTGNRVGMKPAGGISSAKQAISYLVMLNEVLGEEWLNNEYFRFGASSLLNDVILQLDKSVKGSYSSDAYIGID